MDRLAQLIGKLNEQFAQKAGPAQLMLTLRQIESELLQLQAAGGKALGTAKVAVMMPSASLMAVPETAEIPVEKVPEPPVTKPAKAETWKEEVLRDIPTLAQQEPRKELNEAMAGVQASLNDSLKNPVLEVGHLLTEAPIRDLKKGIGVNDRFVFISELFRGDEAMYERSIKTINAFRIFAEAEYWIERELKVKLGWDGDKAVVQHFYQLVKRRFG